MGRAKTTAEKANRIRSWAKVSTVLGFLDDLGVDHADDEDMATAYDMFTEHRDSLAENWAGVAR